MDLITGLHRDLIADRCPSSADWISEEAKRRRAEYEVRGNRERRRRVPGCLTEANSLPASNRVDRHVGEALVLYADGRAWLRNRRGLRLRTARGDCQSEHRGKKEAPCEHRLLRNVLEC